MKYKIGDTMIKTKYEDGIYSISNDEYHSSTAYSRSQLLTLAKTPYHFWYEHLSGRATPKEETEALIVGSALHTLILEPHLFEHSFAVLPKLDRRTKEGKKDYELFITENPNQKILTQEQFDKINSIKSHIMEHDVVPILLKDSVYEQSLFWTDKDTGLQFKARPDIWSKNMIMDLKSTDDSSLLRFKASAYKYGYYLQAAMLYEACMALDKPFKLFVILAIEKKEPYVPSVFIIKGEALDFGLEQFDFYKKQLYHCLKSNRWSAFSIHELDVPSYATINEVGD